ncbi:MAG: hypothetical protein R6U39_06095 [Candidatus Aegiribacteria sp.]
MRWSEIGLLALAAAAVTGFFLVVTGHGPVPPEEEGTPVLTDPLDLLERDLSGVIYGPGFRDVPSASTDTIVRSMDLVDSLPLARANLYITRALRERGFGHSITYREISGLSFICHTPEGEPLRLELNNSRL